MNNKVYVIYLLFVKIISISNESANNSKRVKDRYVSLTSTIQLNVKGSCSLF